MRNKLLILTFLFLLSGAQPVLANDPPTLLSPSNTGTTTSSKLEWQTSSYQLYTTKPYNIQVDENPDFTTPDKDYDTNNTYYSPVLDPKTWYWKVRARDSNGSWSNWSSVWSFILTAPSASSSANSETSSPSPTPTSSFAINNAPSQINSDQSFNVSVTIFPNGNYYCKGAFKKADNSNYFGLTKVSGNWIKNNSNFTNQYHCTGDFNLEAKPDVDDTGYTGTGDYIFKVARYDANGENLTWSNEVIIKINNINISPTPIPQTITKPSASPSISPSPKSSKSPATTSPEPTNDYRIASVEAAETATPEEMIEDKKERGTNLFMWVGIAFIFAGSGLIGYIYLKKKRLLFFRNLK